MNPLFDREEILAKPLSQRINKLDVEKDAVAPLECGIPLSDAAASDVERAATEIRQARGIGAPVMLAFGAHSIKNGLAGVLIRLMRGGFVTHFATNGAGIIHDWEFAFQGRTAEDVRRYVAEGQFGIWEETGLYLNLAIALGAHRGLGYGESIGTMVLEEGLAIPARAELAADLAKAAEIASSEPGPSRAAEAAASRAAASADLLELLSALERRDPAKFPREGGFLRIEHPWKDRCLSAAAVAQKVPFTCHPMYGHDIIYTHPASRGAPIGRSAERDFLSFAESVSKLQGGVYLSVGSAVMSPMIFEKSLSMSRNIARQRGERIDDFSIHVVDLAASSWDWNSSGEPPQDDPSYYLRYCKTFSRMGGRMSYTSADNRAWLSALTIALGA